MAEPLPSNETIVLPVVAHCGLCRAEREMLNPHYIPDGQVLLKNHGHPVVEGNCPQCSQKLVFLSHPESTTAELEPAARIGAGFAIFVFVIWLGWQTGSRLTLFLAYALLAGLGFGAYLLRKKLPNRNFIIPLAVVGALSVLAASGNHEIAAQDYAAHLQRQAQAGRARAEHKRQAELNHERRAAWNRAHPTEFARMKAAARAQIAARQAAAAARTAATERKEAESARLADEIPARTKAAVADFDSHYPNNTLILQIKVNPNDPTSAIILVDKGEWDAESPSLQLATERALRDQWSTIYASHGLNGDSSAHLGYQFTSFFDSR